ncbi:MAG: glycine betaine ABC transporter substrate-binding protein [Candidatus Aenigmatarchaeota archaeon]
MINKKLIMGIAIILFLISLFSIVLPFFNSQTKKTESKGTITLATPSWTGSTIKTHVVKNVLEDIGYNTEIKNLDVGIIYNQLAEGKVDIFVESWLPTTHAEYLEEYNNSLNKINVNLDETFAGLTVPEYVYNEGIHSITDLKNKSEEFGDTILCIGAGDGMTLNTEEAIEKYNLTGFECKTSSTSAMLAQVERFLNKDEWFVNLAWEPHYMFFEFPLKKLDDPIKAYGGQEELVYTITRNGFERDYPEAAEFLKAFEVTTEDQNNWIYSYAKKEIEPNKIAEDWIKNNSDRVNNWLG